jgi:glycosyltransferase involved in cell wall biosynthesis
MHSMRPTELKAGPDELESRSRECYRALLRRTEVSLITVADACKRDYLDWIGLDDASNVHAVYNGIDFSDIESAVELGSRATVRTQFGIDEHTPLVGTAFRFVELKRPFLWVDAAAIVLAIHPECRFIMFGDGEERDRTIAYINSRGLNRNFSLPGLVSDLYRHLPMLDAFVLSSRTEGLPNVLIEAQAAGVPVVAYDVGGVGETMLDGVTGFLVKEETAEALAAGILRALEEPDWHAHASSVARSFVKQRFNTETMVRSLSDVLLLNSKPNKTARSLPSLQYT